MSPNTTPSAAITIVGRSVLLAGPVADCTRESLPSARLFASELGGCVSQPCARRTVVGMPDELDALYAAKPEDFTALRTKLAAEAKKRGDADATKRISSARKPTTAAWVVNGLVHADAEVKPRLTELGERL